ncbi:hypothetical protein [Vreelandella boliviensis]|uniref:hypothetical protein n=1 Tax=Vreelandella boliviensis TaxID=223527 RepID=UPI001B8C0B68|nr:hypothetical protein [Halomonas boliviensis]MBS3670203.1 hypothetical protein [Halomonas boliviensis]
MKKDRKYSIYADELIKSFQESGVDIKSPATIEDVCIIVGGAAEHIIREHEAQRQSDKIVQGLLKPKGE